MSVKNEGMRPLGGRWALVAGALNEGLGLLGTQFSTCTQMPNSAPECRAQASEALEPALNSESFRILLSTYYV